jgi:hypothetical protein
MLANKTLYLELRRERTFETLVLELNSALTTIKKYDEKQQFMNMLGQENFWKKNRLDLWSALKQDAIDLTTLKPEDKDMRFTLPAVAFQNTPKMLPSIKERLKVYFELEIQQRRALPEDTCKYDSWNHIYQNGERVFVSRAVRIDVPNHYIRTEDVAKFDQELKKLLNKYVVSDPLRLKNGKRRLNFRTVANRYVERVFGFPVEKNDYRYW